MSRFSARLRRLVFGISPRETTFERRGFAPGRDDRQVRFERIGREFLRGYHAAIEESDLRELERRLSDVTRDFRGFAWEGAAMGEAILDCVIPGRRRFERFLELADPFVYLAHVGVGWAWARLPGFLRSSSVAPDPVLRPLVVDGTGFHEGYFHARRVIREHRVPRGLRGYDRRAFDQGLGRCLWFHDCADVFRLSETVAGFPEERRADLWSGVGLACAYAGGADDGEIAALGRAAGPARDHLAQGIAFGAKAHERAGCFPSHTEAACRIVLSGSIATAAAVCDKELGAARGEGPASDASYEIWRSRVRARVSAPAVFREGAIS